MAKPTSKRIRFHHPREPAVAAVSAPLRAQTPTGEIGRLKNRAWALRASIRKGTYSNNDGLQPTSDGLQPKFMASNLIFMASNLIAMPSNLL